MPKAKTLNQKSIEEFVRLGKVVSDMTPDEFDELSAQDQRAVLTALRQTHTRIGDFIQARTKAE